ncbi:MULTISPECIES: hypothetical protein [unclassified Lysobacter]|uniref:hypothetical protein n=1 Tax=unclassified Lysobacter TaxID=2635362 RepID=UPI0007013D95|nr:MULTISPECIES: hypothetical protein [unclassified Lysobacter]KQZ57538.1 hypothetical protein ASD53_07850 [Lysobacter sp. Root559]KRC33686.1 hypothetical protein ASE10_12010 [Lysobacter sp. Root76]KRD69023.1 hypothetical protein ASE45_07460 [Lysobacter sp. Root96]
MNAVARTPSSHLLRRATQLDAVATAAVAALLIAAAAPLSQWLHLPQNLLLGAGLLLVPYVAFLGWLLSRERISTAQAWAMIAINACWVIDSVLLLVSGWVSPNALGVAFVVAQALAVAVFAELQYFGLRRQQRG